MRFVERDAQGVVKRSSNSEQYPGQEQIDDNDPDLLVFRNRHIAAETAIAQGRLNARNANSLPQLIQALKDAGII